MNVLITGAGGFVGSYLAEELRRTEPEARLFGLGRSPEGLSRVALSSGLEPLTVDLLDEAALRQAIYVAEPDRVFHLAGHAAARGSRDEIFCANVTATENLLRVLSERGAPARVVISGSGYVYGPCNEEAPATEDAPLNPRGDYAQSKAEMERVALSPEWPASLSIRVARAFNHTGPGQDDRFVVPSLARQVARVAAGRERVVRAGNLSSRRDFLDVRDVVAAYRLLMEGDSDRSVVNICSGTAVRIAEILGTLSELAGVPVATEVEPERQRASDLPVVVGNPQRLRDWTGWSPRIPLRQTLSDTLSWWKGQFS